MLLAGFVPLLQVTFIVLLEGLSIRVLAVKDQVTIHRSILVISIIGLIYIMWYQILG